jgi:peptidoglycan/xylan/chitin deacetylase (PgdA/CDA1 family)
LIRIMSEPIPVLMYHSIAPEIKGWAYSYLSIHPDMFEDHLSTLKAAGYVSVSLAELYAYMAGEGRLPPKAIVLTFDDGYLDNWVFAFPILRKYGFRATVYVSTDFIDRTEKARPNLADVWDGRTTRENLEWRGFLCQDEMIRMMTSDLIDIEGHCKTHTWHFTSDKIVDFHHPGDGYPWLAWNARPDRKPLYLREDQTDFVPLGSPVYEHRKAVVARRYFPDPVVEQKLIEHVAASGAEQFFAKSGWREELRDVARGAAGEAGSGRTETDEEQMTRLRDEISLSKDELESVLGRQVRFLCWPGGSYDERAVEIAREAGYKAYTLSSRDTSPQRNLPGEDPAWVRRTAVAPWWMFRGKRRAFVDGQFLERIIYDYKGFAFGGFRLRWLKLGKLLGSFFR